MDTKTCRGARPPWVGGTSGQLLGPGAPVSRPPGRVEGIEEMLNTGKTNGLDAGGPFESAPQPLRVCVQKALAKYFADLDGHPPGDLYQMVIREVECPLLEAVMTHAAGNQTRAAGILGINRSTLRKRLRAYGLDK